MRDDKKYLFKNFKASQRLRKELGLRLLEPKNIPCIRCGKVFYSYDVRLNRMCPDCRKISEYYYVREA